MVMNRVKPARKGGERVQQQEEIRERGEAKGPGAGQRKAREFASPAHSGAQPDNANHEPSEGDNAYRPRSHGADTGDEVGPGERLKSKDQNRDQPDDSDEECIATPERLRRRHD